MFVLRCSFYTGHRCSSSTSYLGHLVSGVCADMSFLLVDWVVIWKNLRGLAKWAYNITLACCDS